MLCLMGRVQLFQGIGISQNLPVSSVWWMQTAKIAGKRCLIRYECPIRIPPFHSIPFHSIPFLPFQAIPFHSITPEKKKSQY